MSAILMYVSTLIGKGDGFGLVVERGNMWRVTTSLGLEFHSLRSVEDIAFKDFFALKFRYFEVKAARMCTCVHVGSCFYLYSSYGKNQILNSPPRSSRRNAPPPPPFLYVLPELQRSASPSPAAAVHCARTNLPPVYTDPTFPHNPLSNPPAADTHRPYCLFLQRSIHA